MNKKQTGIEWINIDSELNEGSGKLSLSAYDNLVLLTLMQTHEYGMDAEIELNTLEFAKLIDILKRAHRMICNKEMPQKRNCVGLIRLNNSSPTKQGIIIINLFKNYIIFGVSLKTGGDPEIKMNQDQTLALLELFIKMSKGTG
ncbi:hypothetical protein [Paenibacillus lutrae]|uniref:Uncharacterized protein n=1 Tax=Paenibacillus lutrae TaxID=2078573 RepID=A0A7X3K1T3_9BACL|nr:hypothetical protein [Paenibacillus lutrae]MVP02573.1 hypothetical protein [Paenibacillus lutrae]